jgi:hypothetical protein
VCGVSLRGRVALVLGEDARPLVQRVHRRYVEAEGLRLPEVERFLAFDDVALRFCPEAAVTWDERGSDAAGALRTSGLALPIEPTAPR